MAHPLRGITNERARRVEQRSGGRERLLQLVAQGVPLGVTETAIVLGCSREYVRQLYNSGMRKLRAALGAGP